MDIFKMHPDCESSGKCQHAEDIGMPDHYCEKVCQYRREHAIHVKRMRNRVYIAVGMAAAAALTATLILGVINNG